MAYEEILEGVGSLLSAADFSTTGQYRFGTIDSSGTVGLTGAAARADGVIQNNPESGQAVYLGTKFGMISKIELGGTVTAGDNLQSGANGVAVTGTTYVLGTAIESGVSGDIISMLWAPKGAVA